MTDFPNVPDNPYQYENTFDYSVWTPNTEIQCCNVKWDSSYRDVVWFDSIQDRDSYFESLSSYSFIINNMIYLRYGEPVRVNAPFSVVNKFNYLVVRNKIQPVPSPIDIRTPDTFFYFITDVEYIAPNTTQMNLQLDVWTTYHNNVDFGLCYINRGHIGIANENSTEYNLIDYLTDLEGLELGGEYEIIHQEAYNMQEEAPIVIIVSSANLAISPGTISNPNLATSTGGVIDDLPQGCNLYGVNANDFMEFMTALSSYPWFSQCIIQISLFPSNFVNRTSITPLSTFLGVSMSSYDYDVYNLNYVESVDQNISFINFFQNFRSNLPVKYQILKKFMTFPYCCLEVTSLTGGDLICKPECFNSTGENWAPSFTFKSVLTPGDTRVLCYPEHYNTSKSGDISIESAYVGSDISPSSAKKQFDFSGESLDMNIVVDNFPQLSIVNNMYQYKLAASAHTRNYQFNQADWSFNKALAGAETQRANEMLGIQQTADLASANAAAQHKQAVISAVQTMGNGAIDSVGMIGRGLIGAGTQAYNNGATLSHQALTQDPNMGGVGSNAAGIAGNTIVNVGVNNAHTAVNTMAGMASANIAKNLGLKEALINMQAAAGKMNNNYAYQKYAAKGDYALDIQGIQAQYRDMQLTQPTTSGLNGGNCFNFSNGCNVILFKWKMIKRNYIEQIGSFWLRYGYYVNRWMVPPKNLKCMDKFTYWKMAFCALDSSMVPEAFKETIRGILESGVTVWSNADDINITMLDDNRIISGIRY